MENKINCSAATVSLLAKRREEFRPGFTTWVIENWRLYVAFENEAMQIIKTGRRHYSARTIGEYLRHHTATREVAGQYKLNDHTIPDMARLFAIRNPQHAGLFEFRGSPNRPRPCHAQGYANMDNEVAA